MHFWPIGIFLIALVTALVVYDLTQRRHATLRNVPIIGHFRFSARVDRP